MQVEQLLAFIQERWMVLLIALIVVIIVVSIVKTVVKWVIALVIIVAIVFYAMNYTPESLKAIGADLSTKVMSDLKAQALKVLTDDAKDAKYEVNKDGSFTITTKNIKLEGKVGEQEVKVTILGQSFSMDMDQAVQAFIEQAKKNSSSK